MNARTRSDILAAASGMTAARAARKMVEDGGNSEPSTLCDFCGDDVDTIVSIESRNDPAQEARRVLLETVEFAIEAARGEVDP